MTDTKEGSIRCPECGQMVPADQAEFIPRLDDHPGWDRLALAHAVGCPWVKSRGHRLDRFPRRSGLMNRRQTISTS